jgi:molybdopterin-containing oxidoreductase family iron-sulfur binding subunit
MKKKVWQSWENQNPSSRADEFSPDASFWPFDLSRRQFLSLAAASLATASLAGCTRNTLEKMIPYLETPEGVTPGKPQFFSSGWSLAGQTHGLLVESHDGRPTRIDGHPLHPASLGKSNAIHQALLLSLYDEDRQRQVWSQGRKSSLDDFKNEMQKLRENFHQTGGQGLVFLSELSSSPSLRAQWQSFQKIYPRAEWLQYEPVSLQSEQQALRKIFSRAVAPLYQFDKAEVVVSLDADIFADPLYPLRYTVDFFRKRAKTHPAEKATSLFVIEPTPSVTGAWTDQRLSLRASRIHEFARVLWQKLNHQSIVTSLTAVENTFLERLIRQVQSFPGRCLFLAGPYQPQSVHEIAQALNFRYGQKAISYRTMENSPTQELTALDRLADRLEKKQVQALFVIGGNPVYQSPANLALREKIKSVPNSYRFSLLKDETSKLCQWQLPLAHPFECWSDGEAYDGTVSLHQPLLPPLREGLCFSEILSFLQGDLKSSADLVRSFWSAKLGPSMAWEKMVQTGLSPLPKPRFFQPTSVKIPELSSSPSAVTEKEDSVEILFRADPHVWDGRFVNNPWLQELPKPLTLLTWGNAALISPALAKKKNIQPGQVIEMKTSGASLKAPAWIFPGQEEQTVTLHFGYGQQTSGKIGQGLGFNAYQLWNSHEPYWQKATLRVTSEKEKLACTQDHWTMEEEDPVRTLPRTAALAVTTTEIQPASIYPENPYAERKDIIAKPEAWAMVIDLDHCIGCNACTVACQSENNIPVVGKEGVLRGREMHWLRVDRYFSGDENSPRYLFQPVPCMQCEKAPCEEVCPVAATVHSTDGLNQMVYNRCVGTRYCANNCPYHVRRFNFLSFSSGKGNSRQWQKNPDVSVRPRGVMEKCTYCVQRIVAARIEAEKEQRPLRDGEVKTACQVACPTEAIVFGNRNDPQAEVSRRQKVSRNYALLEELGTRPRTTYLAKLEDVYD